MRRGAAVPVLVLGVFVPLAAAEHDAGCVPTAADPSTYLLLRTPTGRQFYLEERDNPLGTTPPVPLSGFVLGGGTWLYEERNGINAPEGSLQRGGCSPGVQRCVGGTGCLPPDPFPCILINSDPVQDENCAHGSDTRIR